MKIEIQFFGQLTDFTKCNAMYLDHVYDTDELQKILFEKYPQLKELKFMIALNNKIIRTKTDILSESKIAIMPPFSGG